MIVKLSEHLNYTFKCSVIETTVKLGYYELDGTSKICSLQPGFVITGLMFYPDISEKLIIKNRMV